MEPLQQAAGCVRPPGESSVSWNPAPGQGELITVAYSVHEEQAAGSALHSRQEGGRVKRARRWESGGWRPKLPLNSSFKKIFNIIFSLVKK